MADAFQPGGRAPAPAPLDLVQDFVNTEIPDWDRDASVEGGTFALARALRAGLRDLALANTLGQPLERSREAEIDATLARLPLAVRLVEGAPVLAPDADGAERGLTILVAIVAEARLRGVWERVKACRQETCGWIFYDGSRNRSSSWCSMQICGGREKARAYRRRTAARH